MWHQMAADCVNWIALRVQMWKDMWVGGLWGGLWVVCVGGLWVVCVGGIDDEI